METMHELQDISTSATLRDYKQENVDAARALAQEFGLENVAVERGDAFDGESICRNHAARNDRDRVRALRIISHE